MGLENIKEIIEEILKGKKVDIPKQLSPEIMKKLKARMNKNPGAVQSTKSLKTESDIKKLREFVVKPPVKSAEGPKKPTLRGFFKDEGKAPVERKKGGEVKKKSKKSGRLAKRGYGISR